MSISSELQNSLRIPVKELTLSFEDISSTTQLFSRASRLRPRLNGILRWDDMEPEERRLVEDFVNHREVDGRLIALSLVVVCYGLLEKFVRELIERAVKAIDAELRNFDRLPESLTQENIFRTGKALQSIKGTRSHDRYEYSSLARNLGTCIPGSGRYTLNAACFSAEPGILTPTNIDQMFQRIGINLDWDKFGSNSALKRLLGEPRTRDCKYAVQKLLRDIVTKRNTVAHSGGLGIVVDDSEFQLIIEFIPVFCTELVEHVAAKLQTKYG
jgi:RiboL-PSP-HEPN